MNFVGGALPNVMFLIGVMAIGIGLGLEFKIVEIKGNLSQSARFGAMGVGAALIGLSIFLYLKPDVLSAQTSGMSAPAANTASTPVQAVSPLTDAVSEAPPVPPPSVAPMPTTAPTQALAAPLQTVAVPDLQRQSAKDAEHLLTAAGLVLGEQHNDCAAIGATATKAPKGKISCQRPAPGTMVAPGMRIDYVMADKDKD